MCFKIKDQRNQNDDNKKGNSIDILNNVLVCIKLQKYKYRSYQYFEIKFMKNYKRLVIQ